MAAGTRDETRATGAEIVSAPGEQDALEAQLRQLRETAQPELARRLNIIEGGIDAVQEGRRDPERIRAAQREAHRLVGSLGVLGFAGATELARRLNWVLESAPGSAPGAAQAQRAAQLLATLRQQLVSNPPGGRENSAPYGEPAPPRGIRVLLAEDDETVATAVAVALRLDGIELLWARDGAEAIELASADVPDLVLLDLDLPDLDGLEVCRRLRSDPRLATLPIVLLTAHVDAHRTRPGDPCVTAHLAKPFRVADLRQQVRALLAGGPERGPL
jgi:CheY-like chemotaxis protein